MPRHGISPAFAHASRFQSHDASSLRARRGKRRSRTKSPLAVESLDPRVLLSGYTIVDLGTLGGNSSQANAINAAGQVVGSAQLANGTSHAVLWNPGQAGIDLGTLGGSSSTALAINLLGEIVGSSDTGSATDPFDFQPGGSMTDLTNAPPESTLATLLTARGVTDTGLIVGQALFNEIDLFATGAYSFDPPSGTLIGLDSARGVSETTAVSGINAVGNLVDNNLSQAFVAGASSPDSAINLPAIANQTQSVAIGLSAPNGMSLQFATGYAIDSSGGFHSVVWTIPEFAPQSATVLDLGHVSGAAEQGPSGREARGANGLGDIVGDDMVGGNPVAFFKDHAGAITLLSSLLPSGSGVTLEHATGINDSGQISATGIKGGKEHAFLLTPVVAAPPQAKLTSAPNVTGFGATTYTLQVTYTDSDGIDFTTAGSGAVVVTSTASDPIIPLSVDFSGPPQKLVVTFSFTPPGGSWDFGDDGNLYRQSLA